jgi:hypothetical protein
MGIVPGPWKTVSTRAEVDEADARLVAIKSLWEQLARLRANSKNYEDLVREIRKEADAFRKFVDAQKLRE